MSATAQRFSRIFYAAVALIRVVRRDGILELIRRGSNRIVPGEGHGHKPDNHAPVSLNIADFRVHALVIDTYIPMPDRDSGSGRMVQMLEILQSFGFGVSFAPADLGYQYPYADQLLKTGIDVLYSPRVKSLKAWLDVHGEALSLVVLSRVGMANRFMGLVRRFCPNAKIIFDTVDLHYLREQRQATIEHSWLLSACARVRKQQEIGLACLADHTLVVSDAERDALLVEQPRLPVSVVSNIHEAHGRTVEFEQRSGLLFIGNFSHPPNVDAMIHFVADIFPMIRARLPDIELTIIGSNMKNRLRVCKVPGVKLLGYVENIVPYLECARISVAPLRYGAGVKGKVNLSMSYGLPVVATPVAAEGMGLDNGVNILVAENEEEFSNQVVTLYNDKPCWNELSDHGLKAIEDKYSVSVAKSRLSRVLGELAVIETSTSS